MTPGMWYSSHMTTMSDEDQTRAAYDDEQYEQWASAHAEQLYRDAYEARAGDARADGDDASEDAYLAYLERMLPDD